MSDGMAAARPPQPVSLPTPPADSKGAKTLSTRRRTAPPAAAARPAPQGAPTCALRMAASDWA